MSLNSPKQVNITYIASCIYRGGGTCDNLGGGGGENKIGLWIVLGIPRSYVYTISPPLAQQSHGSYT